MYKRQALDRALDELPERSGGGKPRLPVDRVFTMAGFGTVVTGTLLDGAFAVGMEVELSPAGRRARVRGLQAHGSAVERAEPGRRVAVNLQGIGVEEIGRGDVVTVAGGVPATRMIDVRLELLPGAPLSLVHQARVDLFTGSAEVGARVALIEREVLAPGEDGWAQLHLDAPIAILRGDRVVIRRPSPSATIGGGTVVDVHPRRHRRSESGVADRLEILAGGTPVELVVAALGSNVLTGEQIARLVPALDSVTVDQAIDQATRDGEVLMAGPSHLVSAAAWQELSARMAATVARFHRDHPLRRGIPREELRSRVKVAGGTAAFDAAFSLASTQGIVRDDERTVRSPGFAVVLPPQDQAAAERYLRLVDETPYSPPSGATVGLSAATLAALVERGDVIDVGDGIVYRPETLDRIKALVLARIEGHGKITLAAYRDLVGTSRKYAQATLEYLDGIRVTRRVGDDRVRGR